MSSSEMSIQKAVEALKITEKVKLKVLCLHGYRQNADQFKSKIGSFRKFLKPLVDFDFIDAPHVAKRMNQEDKELDEQRGWWFNQADGSFNIEQGPAALGFDESLKCLEEAWQKSKFDGILAFSQGASFLSVVCAMSQKNLTPVNPDFVILVSGFKSVSSQHEHFYNDKIDIPSLHVSGSTDKVIPHEMHILLEESFVDPVTFHHEGGHHLPATVAEKPTYKTFFEDRLSKKLDS